MHGKGLTKLPKDRRDWSYHKNFGAAALTGVPDQYLLVSTIIDQNGWNECTGYMKEAIDESEFSTPAKTITFSPAWNYAKEGAESPPPTQNGYSMRTPFQVGADYGALPMVAGLPTEAVMGFPFTLDPKNWNPALDAQAVPYQHPGYAAVHGPYDNFDSIRSAMWLEKAKTRCVGVGVMWYNEWTNAPSGVIPETYSSKDGLHAIKIAGWSKTKRDGTLINPTTQEIYLVIQNSWSESEGDGGLYYMSRAVADRELDPIALGIYIFSDNALDNPKTVSALQNLLNNLVSLLQTIKNRFGYPPVVPSQVIPTIEQWAAAIAKAEGADPTINNPGDLKLTSLTTSWGATAGFAAQDGGFIAKFATEAIGMTALCNFLALGKENLLLAFHQARTLGLFMKVFAGNPPQKYLNSIYAELGVDASFNVSNFLS